MAGYGEILEPFEPDLDLMYKAFVKYFNNPVMIKIKNVDKYSMYMIKNYCLLSKECRYMVALIPKDDFSMGQKQSLEHLRWVSFQTRTLESDHDLPPHSYNAVRGGPLDAEIVRIKCDEKASTYRCVKFPFTVTLLHTKNNINEYTEKGTVVTALETFQTIVALNNV
jgi:hypothetical protein